jgi:hypothetical protein
MNAGRGDRPVANQPCGEPTPWRTNKKVRAAVAGRSGPRPPQGLILDRTKDAIADAEWTDARRFGGDRESVSAAQGDDFDDFATSIDLGKGGDFRDYGSTSCSDNADFNGSFGSHPEKGCSRCPATTAPPRPPIAFP